VQYTRSHVSVQCTKSSNPRLTISVLEPKNGVLMSDEPNKGLQSPLRRKLLMGAAALPLISMLPRPSFGAVPPPPTVKHHGVGVTDTEVTCGILHSATVRWRFRKPVRSKPRSSPSRRSCRRRHSWPQDQDHPGRRRQRLVRPSRKKQEAAGQRQGRGHYGCWTRPPAGVLPVVEQYNGMLYYPTFYEGLEQSKNVIYTGPGGDPAILAG